jgi:mRNA interferase HigB
MLIGAMRIIARSSLVRFWERHPETKASLLHWLSIAREAQWATPQDAQTAFSKAVVLNGERVRYEVAGGNYRLVVAFDFRRLIAFVKFIGTHDEYDAIDALTVSRF